MPETLDDLLKQIKSNQVEKIKFSYDDYKYDTKTLAKIAELLPANKSVFQLWFNGCEFKKKDIELVCEIISNSPNLEVLIIDGCGVDNTGLKQIGSTLKTNPKLKGLQFIYDDFSSEGLKPFCKALEKNTNLKTLDFLGTRLDDASAICIADMLKVNKSLKGISSSKNTIYNEGGIALIKAATVNHNINDLVLDAGLLDDTIVDDLITLLDTNKNLAHIHLNDNQITDETIDKLAAAVKRKRAELPEFDFELQANRISIYGITALADVYNNTNLIKENYDQKTKAMQSHAFIHYVKELVDYMADNKITDKEMPSTLIIFEVSDKKPEAVTEALKVIKSKLRMGREAASLAFGLLSDNKVALLLIITESEDDYSDAPKDGKAIGKNILARVIAANKEAGNKPLKGAVHTLDEKTLKLLKSIK